MRASVRFIRAACVTLLAAGTLVGTAVPAGAATRRENVSWTNGRVKLAGTLHLPEGAGPHPAMVFLHGSGNMTRSELLFPLYASKLTARGIALLAYDKRGCGESTGDWLEGTYRDLALDAVGGAELLAGRADIDAGRIGLIGQSEGGWTAPLAASLSPQVSYLIMLSGAPMSPVEQEYYEYQTELEKHGVPDDQIAEALSLLQARREAYRTQDWEPLRQAIDAARGRPWFEKWGTAELPNVTNKHYRWYRRVMDFDPLPILTGLKIPVYAVYGEKDVLVPARRSAEIMRRIRDEHHQDMTIETIAGAAHNLSTSTLSWPDEHWQRLLGWLDRQLRRPAK